MPRSEFRFEEDDGAVVVPNALNVASRGDEPGPLLLFLAGTGSTPRHYRSFLDVAASEGFQALGLEYANRGASVSATCGSISECYTLLHRNRFDGTSPSVYSRVDRAGSIVGRLVRAVALLDVRDPGGHWGHFITGPEILWQDVVVAGHSQGGGIAAFIAHHHRVLGQLTFGAPILTDGVGAATWMATPSATPASTMWALASEHDTYFARIEESWRRLGIEGRQTAAIPVTTDTAVHRFVSTLDLGGAAAAHRGIIKDDGPLDPAGVPRFVPTWRAMLRRVRAISGARD